MAVMENAFPKTYGEGWNQFQCRSMLSMPTTQILLAETERQICGFAISRRAADEEELLMIAVTPAFQNQHIATMLLTEILDSARTNNILSIFLEVRANNPAQQLYRKFGFEQIGIRKGYYTGTNNEKFDAVTYKANILV